MSKLDELFEIFKQWERQDGNSHSQLVLFADGSGWIIEGQNDERVIMWHDVEKAIAMLQPLKNFSINETFTFLRNNTFCSNPYRYEKK